MINLSDENESSDVQEVDENVIPGTRSCDEANNLQYRLASERNRRRWNYEEMYEMDAIETYIEEDDVTKQRRSISQAVRMSEIVLNIQEALHSGIKHDLSKVIENLEKLLKEPFTTMSLLYVPSIVKTVYLCCRYANSGEVRELAEKCYKRFEPCFGVPYGETFETAFQAEVREFWETQNTFVYDITKCDWRHFTMDDPSPETGGFEGQDANSETGDLEEQNDNEEMEETKIKIENIKLESEVDDKSLVKKEIKQELTDNTDLIQKIEEYSDDKCQVKKEIKTECEAETDNMIIEIVDDTDIEIIDDMDDTLAHIKKEDPDDIEIIHCNVKSNMPESYVKLEPLDFNEFM